MPSPTMMRSPSYTVVASAAAFVCPPGCALPTEHAAERAHVTDSSHKFLVFNTRMTTSSIVSR
jgi:hypothetical protein